MARKKTEQAAEPAPAAIEQPPCPAVAITTFKGFDKDLSCRGHKFEIGQTYTLEGKIEACNRGWHACEYPLDVFNYYAPGVSRFAVVEQSGDLSRHVSDTKVASASITIKAELHFPEIVAKAIEWVSSKLDPAKASHTNEDRSASSATGYQSASSATGDQSASSATGDRSASSATGDRSASSATGDQSASSVSGVGAVAMAIGCQSKVMASEGGAIVAVYRNDDWDLVHIRAAKVGGPEGIKPDVYYTLDADGAFVEATSEDEE